MREDATGKVTVPGLSEWIVLKPEDIMELMRRGDAKRKIASTNMNKQSSRSHAIFQMVRSPPPTVSIAPYTPCAPTWPCVCRQFRQTTERACKVLFAPCETPVALLSCTEQEHR